MKSPATALLVLVPVLLVAAAWWASSGSQEEALRAELDALRGRVADLERVQEERTAALRSADRRAARVEERLVEAELRAARASVPQAPRPAARPPDSSPGGEEPSGSRSAGESPAPDAEASAQTREHAARALDRLGQKLGENMKGIERKVATIALRRLPESERWERARTEVGLNENQAAVLRQAIAERDAAYAAGSEQEKRQEDDGSWVVETRVDAALLDEGDNRYAGAVHGVMTADQERRWVELGFSDAFGRRRPAPATRRYAAKR